MAIHYLASDDPLFPDPEEADADGLLAVGGDLSPARLVAAYAQGIFPWFGPGDPILWWSPDPRCVLDPATVRASPRLLRSLRAARYAVTLDTMFAEVIRACAAVPRPGQQGTWIVPAMVRAYTALHRAGLAHSVEIWRGRELVGGLYGVSLGGLFFGESMFHLADHASKAAVLHLCGLLRDWGFPLLDCQQTTPHMLRLGAAEMPRRRFLAMLRLGLLHPTRQGAWTGQGPSLEDTLAGLRAGAGG